jgi:hypothetical protein
MKRYHTKSGSIYEVDGLKVRRVTGGEHYQGRACDDWLDAQEVRATEGLPMYIYWGAGRDEYSPDDGLPDAERQRFTITSQVVRVEEV